MPIPDDLVIDASNFDRYFFDTKRHKPKPGQVMARYNAVAHFEDGALKRDVIELLFRENQVHAATRILEVMGNCRQPDSVKVCREMASDLLSGMTKDEVAKKPYKFIFEKVYWAEKGIVPENDPHWYVIPALTWGKLVDQMDFPDEETLTES